MAKNSAIQNIECLQGWLNHLEANRKRKGIKRVTKKVTADER
jgi:hypothetical protein